MNERIAKAKSYITTHAPEIVTAVAALGILAVITKSIKDTADTRERQTAALGQAHDENWNFDFYPGIGLFVHDQVITED